MVAKKNNKWGSLNSKILSSKLTSLKDSLDDIEVLGPIKEKASFSEKNKAQMPIKEKKPLKEKFKKEYEFNDFDYLIPKGQNI